MADITTLPPVFITWEPAGDGAIGRKQRREKVLSYLERTLKGVRKEKDIADRDSSPATFLDPAYLSANLSERTKTTVTPDDIIALSDDHLVPQIYHYFQTEPAKGSKSWQLYIDEKDGNVDTVVVSEGSTMREVRKLRKEVEIAEGLNSNDSNEEQSTRNGEHPSTTGDHKKYLEDTTVKVDDGFFGKFWIGADYNRYAGDLSAARPRLRDPKTNEIITRPADIEEVRWQGAFVDGSGEENRSESSSSRSNSSSTGSSNPNSNSPASGTPTVESPTTDNTATTSPILHYEYLQIKNFTECYPYGFRHYVCGRPRVIVGRRNRDLFLLKNQEYILDTGHWNPIAFHDDFGYRSRKRVCDQNRQTASLFPRLSNPFIHEPGHEHSSGIPLGKWSMAKQIVSFGRMSFVDQHSYPIQVAKFEEAGERTKNEMEVATLLTGEAVKKFDTSFLEESKDDEPEKLDEPSDNPRANQETNQDEDEKSAPNEDDFEQLLSDGGSIELTNQGGHVAPDGTVEQVLEGKDRSKHYHAPSKIRFSLLPQEKDMGYKFRDGTILMQFMIQSMTAWFREADTTGFIILSGEQTETKQEMLKGAYHMDGVEFDIDFKDPFSDAHSSADTSAQFLALPSKLENPTKSFTLKHALFGRKSKKGTASDLQSAIQFAGDGAVTPIFPKESTLALLFQQIVAPAKKTADGKSKSAPNPRGMTSQLQSQLQSQSSRTAPQPPFWSWSKPKFIIEPEMNICYDPNKNPLFIHPLTPKVPQYANSFIDDYAGNLISKVENGIQWLTDQGLLGKNEETDSGSKQQSGTNRFASHVMSNFWQPVFENKASRRLKPWVKGLTLDAITYAVENLRKIWLNPVSHLNVDGEMCVYYDDAGTNRDYKDTKLILQEPETIDVETRRKNRLMWRGQTLERDLNNIGINLGMRFRNSDLNLETVRVLQQDDTGDAKDSEGLGGDRNDFDSPEAADAGGDSNSSDSQNDTAESQTGAPTPKTKSTNPNPFKQFNPDRPEVGPKNRVNYNDNCMHGKVETLDNFSFILQFLPAWIYGQAKARVDYEQNKHSRIFIKDFEARIPLDKAEMAVGKGKGMENEVETDSTSNNAKFANANSWNGNSEDESVNNSSPSSDPPNDSPYPKIPRSSHLLSFQFLAPQSRHEYGRHKRYETLMSRPKRRATPSTSAFHSQTATGVKERGGLSSKSAKERSVMRENDSRISVKKELKGSVKTDSVEKDSAKTEGKTEVKGGKNSERQKPSSKSNTPRRKESSTEKSEKPDSPKSTSRRGGAYRASSAGSTSGGSTRTFAASDGNDEDDNDVTKYSFYVEFPKANAVSNESGNADNNIDSSTTNTNANSYPLGSVRAQFYPSKLSSDLTMRLPILRTHMFKHVIDRIDGMEFRTECDLGYLKSSYFPFEEETNPKLKTLFEMVKAGKNAAMIKHRERGNSVGTYDWETFRAYYGDDHGSSTNAQNTATNGQNAPTNGQNPNGQNFNQLPPPMNVNNNIRHVNPKSLNMLASLKSFRAQGKLELRTKILPFPWLFGITGTTFFLSHKDSEIFEPSMEAIRDGKTTNNNHNGNKASKPTKRTKQARGFTRGVSNRNRGRTATSRNSNTVSSFSDEEKALIRDKNFFGEELRELWKEHIWGDPNSHKMSPFQFEEIGFDSLVEASGTAGLWSVDDNLNLEGLLGQRMGMRIKLHNEVKKSGSGRTSSSPSESDEGPEGNDDANAKAANGDEKKREKERVDRNKREAGGGKDQTADKSRKNRRDPNPSIPSIAELLETPEVLKTKLFDAEGTFSFKKTNYITDKNWTHTELNLLEFSCYSLFHGQLGFLALYATLGLLCIVLKIIWKALKAVHRKVPVFTWLKELLCFFCWSLKAICCLACCCKLVTRGDSDSEDEGSNISDCEEGNYSDSGSVVGSPRLGRTSGDISARTSGAMYTSDSNQTSARTSARTSVTAGVDPRASLYTVDSIVSDVDDHKRRRRRRKKEDDHHVNGDDANGGKQPLGETQRNSERLRKGKSPRRNSVSHSQEEGRGLLERAMKLARGSLLGEDLDPSRVSNTSANNDAKDNANVSENILEAQQVRPRSSSSESNSSDSDGSDVSYNSDSSASFPSSSDDETACDRDYKAAVEQIAKEARNRKIIRYFWLFFFLIWSLTIPVFLISRSVQNDKARESNRSARVTVLSFDAGIRNSQSSRPDGANSYLGGPDNPPSNVQVPLAKDHAIKLVEWILPEAFRTESKWISKVVVWFLPDSISLSGNVDIIIAEPCMAPESFLGGGAVAKDGSSDSPSSAKTKKEQTRSESKPESQLDLSSDGNPMFPATNDELMTFICVNEESIAYLIFGSLWPNTACRMLLGKIKSGSNKEAVDEEDEAEKKSDKSDDKSKSENRKSDTESSKRKSPAPMLESTRFFSRLGLQRKRDADMLINDELISAEPRSQLSQLKFRALHPRKPFKLEAIYAEEGFGEQQTESASSRGSAGSSKFSPNANGDLERNRTGNNSQEAVQLEGGTQESRIKENAGDVQQKDDEQKNGSQISKNQNRHDDAKVNDVRSKSSKGKSAQRLQEQNIDADPEPQSPVRKRVQITFSPLEVPEVHKRSRRSTPRSSARKPQEVGLNDANNENAEDLNEEGNIEGIENEGIDVIEDAYLHSPTRSSMQNEILAKELDQFEPPLSASDEAAEEGADNNDTDGDPNETSSDGDPSFINRAWNGCWRGATAIPKGAWRFTKKVTMSTWQTGKFLFRKWAFWGGVHIAFWLDFVSPVFSWIVRSKYSDVAKIVSNQPLVKLVYFLFEEVSVDMRKVRGGREWVNVVPESAKNGKSPQSHSEDNENSEEETHDEKSENDSSENESEADETDNKSNKKQEAASTQQKKQDKKQPTQKQEDKTKKRAEKTNRVILTYNMRTMDMKMSQAILSDINIYVPRFRNTKDEQIEKLNECSKFNQKVQQQFAKEFPRLWFTPIVRVTAVTSPYFVKMDEGPEGGLAGNSGGIRDTDRSVASVKGEEISDSFDSEESVSQSDKNSESDDGLIFSDGNDITSQDKEETHENVSINDVGNHVSTDTASNDSNTDIMISALARENSFWRIDLVILVPSPEGLRASDLARDDVNHDGNNNSSNYSKQSLRERKDLLDKRREAWRNEVHKKVEWLLFGQDHGKTLKRIIKNILVGEANAKWLDENCEVADGTPNAASVDGDHDAKSSISQSTSLTTARLSQEFEERAIEDLLHVSVQESIPPLSVWESADGQVLWRTTKTKDKVAISDSDKENADKDEGELEEKKREMEKQAEENAIEKFSALYWGGGKEMRKGIHRFAMKIVVDEIYKPFGLDIGYRHACYISLLNHGLGLKKFEQNKTWLIEKLAELRRIRRAIETKRMQVAWQEKSRQDKVLKVEALRRREQELRKEARKLRDQEGENQNLENQENNPQADAALHAEEHNDNVQESEKTSSQNGGPSNIIIPEETQRRYREILALRDRTDREIHSLSRFWKELIRRKNAPAFDMSLNLGVDFVRQYFLAKQVHPDERWRPRNGRLVSDVELRVEKEMEQQIIVRTRKGKKDEKLEKAYEKSENVSDRSGHHSNANHNNQSNQSNQRQTRDNSPTTNAITLPPMLSNEIVVNLNFPNVLIPGITQDGFSRCTLSDSAGPSSLSPEALQVVHSTNSSMDLSAEPGKIRNDQQTNASGTRKSTDRSSREESPYFSVNQSLFVDPTDQSWQQSRGYAKIPENYSTRFSRWLKEFKAPIPLSTVTPAMKAVEWKEYARIDSQSRGTEGDKWLDQEIEEALQHAGEKERSSFLKKRRNSRLRSFFQMQERRKKNTPSALGVFRHLNGLPIFEERSTRRTVLGSGRVDTKGNLELARGNLGYGDSNLSPADLQQAFVERKFAKRLEKVNRLRANWKNVQAKHRQPLQWQDLASLDEREEYEQLGQPFLLALFNPRSERQRLLKLVERQQGDEQYELLLAQGNEGQSVKEGAAEQRNAKSNADRKSVSTEQLRNYHLKNFSSLADVDDLQTNLEQLSAQDSHQISATFEIGRVHSPLDLEKTYLRTMKLGMYELLHKVLPEETALREEVKLLGKASNGKSSTNLEVSVSAKAASSKSQLSENGENGAQSSQSVTANTPNALWSSHREQVGMRVLGSYVVPHETNRHAEEEAFDEHEVYLPRPAPETPELLKAVEQELTKAIEEEKNKLENEPHEKKENETKGAKEGDKSDGTEQHAASPGIRKEGRFRRGKKLRWDRQQPEPEPPQGYLDKVKAALCYGKECAKEYGGAALKWAGANGADLCKTGIDVTCNLVNKGTCNLAGKYKNTLDTGRDALAVMAQIRDVLADLNKAADAGEKEKELKEGFILKHFCGVGDKLENTGWVERAGDASRALCHLLGDVIGGQGLEWWTDPNFKPYKKDICGNPYHIHQWAPFKVSLQTLVSSGVEVEVRILRKEAKPNGLNLLQDAEQRKQRKSKHAEKETVKSVDVKVSKSDLKNAVAIPQWVTTTLFQWALGQKDRQNTDTRPTQKHNDRILLIRTVDFARPSLSAIREIVERDAGRSNSETSADSVDSDDITALNDKLNILRQRNHLTDDELVNLFGRDVGFRRKFCEALLGPRPTSGSAGAAGGATAAATSTTQASNHSWCETTLAIGNYEPRIQRDSRDETVVWRYWTNQREKERRAERAEHERKHSETATKEDPQSLLHSSEDDEIAEKRIEDGTEKIVVHGKSDGAANTDPANGDASGNSTVSTPTKTSTPTDNGTASGTTHIPVDGNSRAQFKKDVGTIFRATFVAELRPREIVVKKDVSPASQSSSGNNNPKDVDILTDPHALWDKVFQATITHHPSGSFRRHAPLDRIKTNSIKEFLLHRLTLAGRPVGASVSGAKESVRKLKSRSKGNPERDSTPAWFQKATIPWAELNFLVRKLLVFANNVVLRQELMKNKENIINGNGSSGVSQSDAGSSTAPPKTHRLGLFRPNQQSFFAGLSLIESWSMRVRDARRRATKDQNAAKERDRTKNKSKLSKGGILPNGMPLWDSHREFSLNYERTLRLQNARKNDSTSQIRPTTSSFLESWVQVLDPKEVSVMPSSLREVTISLPVLQAPHIASMFQTNSLIEVQRKARAQEAQRKAVRRRQEAMKAKGKVDVGADVSPVSAIEIDKLDNLECRHVTDTVAAGTVQTNSPNRLCVQASNESQENDQGLLDLRKLTKRLNEDPQLQGAAIQALKKALPAGVLRSTNLEFKLKEAGSEAFTAFRRATGNNNSTGASESGSDQWRYNWRKKGLAPHFLYELELHFLVVAVQPDSGIDGISSDGDTGKNLGAKDLFRFGGGVTGSHNVRGANSKRTDNSSSFPRQSQDSDLFSDIFSETAMNILDFELKRRLFPFAILGQKESVVQEKEENATMENSSSAIETLVGTNAFLAATEAPVLVSRVSFPGEMTIQTLDENLRTIQAHTPVSGSLAMAKTSNSKVGVANQNNANGTHLGRGTLVAARGNVNTPAPVINPLAFRARVTTRDLDILDNKIQDHGFRYHNKVPCWQRVGMVDLVSAVEEKGKRKTGLDKAAFTYRHGVCELDCGAVIFTAYDEMRYGRRSNEDNPIEKDEPNKGESKKADGSATSKNLKAAVEEPESTQRSSDPTASLEIAPYVCSADRPVTLLGNEQLAEIAEIATPMSQRLRVSELSELYKVLFGTMKKPSAKSPAASNRSHAAPPSCPVPSLFAHYSQSVSARSNIDPSGFALWNDRVSIFEIYEHRGRNDKAGRDARTRNDKIQNTIRIRNAETKTASTTFHPTARIMKVEAASRRVANPAKSEVFHLDELYLMQQKHALTEGKRLERFLKRTKQDQLMMHGPPASASSAAPSDPSDLKFHNFRSNIRCFVGESYTKYPRALHYLPKKEADKLTKDKKHIGDWPMANARGDEKEVEEVEVAVGRSDDRKKPKSRTKNKKVAERKRTKKTKGLYYQEQELAPSSTGEKPPEPPERFVICAEDRRFGDIVKREIEETILGEGIQSNRFARDFSSAGKKHHHPNATANNAVTLQPFFESQQMPTYFWWTVEYENKVDPGTKADGDAEMQKLQNSHYLQVRSQSYLEDTRERWGLSESGVYSESKEAIPTLGGDSDEDLLCETLMKECEMHPYCFVILRFGMSPISGNSASGTKTAISKDKRNDDGNADSYNSSSSSDRCIILHLDELYEKKSTYFADVLPLPLHELYPKIADTLTTRSEMERVVGWLEKENRDLLLGLGKMRENEKNEAKREKTADSTEDGSDVGEEQGSGSSEEEETGDADGSGGNGVEQSEEENEENEEKKEGQNGEDTKENKVENEKPIPQIPEVSSSGITLKKAYIKWPKME